MPLAPGHHWSAAGTGSGRAESPVAAAAVVVVDLFPVHIRGRIRRPTNLLEHPYLLFSGPNCPPGMLLYPSKFVKRLKVLCKLRLKNGTFARKLALAPVSHSSARSALVLLATKLEPSLALCRE